MSPFVPDSVAGELGLLLQNHCSKRSRLFLDLVWLLSHLTPTQVRLGVQNQTTFVLDLKG